jgi:hypothetical protein
MSTITPVPPNSPTTSLENTSSPESLLNAKNVITFIFVSTGCLCEDPWSSTPALPDSNSGRPPGRFAQPHLLPHCEGPPDLLVCPQPWHIPDSSDYFGIIK